MSANKMYDYVQICSERGYKYLYEDNPYIYVMDEFGFTHKMQRTNFHRGISLGFNGVQGEKSEYFKHIFKLKHGDQSNLFMFGEFKYTKSLDYTTVVCNKHGEYRTKTNWLLTRGHHCEACAEERRGERNFLGNDGFVSKASRVHNGKYDYSLSEYLGARKYIKILCADHGVFEQILYYHLAGNGCPECGKMTGGYGASDYEKICPYGSNVYLMRVENKNEMFYKIGISKQPFKRANDISNSSEYSVSVLSYIYHKDAKMIWTIERELHDLFKQFKYYPQSKFEGHTECFSYIDTDEFTSLCKEYLQ